MKVDYGVLSGEQSCMDFVRTGLEALTGVTDVLFFSDGLLFSQSETLVKLVVDNYRQNSLNKVRDYVREQQSMDNSGLLYPRFKHHDDISSIALRLNS